MYYRHQRKRKTERPNKPIQTPKKERLKAGIAIPFESLKVVATGDTLTDMIKTVTDFGIALIAAQHKYFLEASLDNSEHIPAIERIADTAYQYLIQNGVSADRSSKVKKELIHQGKDLFIQLWVQHIIEEGEVPGKEDISDAERTFDKILKKAK
jgi:hypothetical protein